MLSSIAKLWARYGLREKTAKAKPAKRTGTAIFIGRFQPLHNGHLWAIRQILKKHKKITIAIGSSREHHTYKNPFSFSERKRMIVSCLKKKGITAYNLIGIRDFLKDSDWVAEVKKQRIDIAYTGNPRTQRLLSEAGYKVAGLKRHEGISSAKIRAMMLKGERWQDYVPQEVAGFLEAHNFCSIVKDHK
jgi:nicotinamide-nucleotide adenylyltransferase